MTTAAQDLKFGFIKARPARNTGGWVAWGAENVLTTDSAVTEPQANVWFQFGPTEADVLSKLRQEMTEAYGPDIHFWRQRDD